MASGACTNWRWIVRVSITLALLILPIYSYRLFIKKDYSDFDVYHRTSVRLSQAQWPELYNTSIDAANPFRYAPPVLPFLRPLVYVSPSWGRVFWFWMQWACYALGLSLLHRVLILTVPNSHERNGIIALTFLLILRFCLDSFTIGQVSGPMFLGFTIALYGWLSRRPKLAAFGLFWPTLLKIGPGILYFLLATEGAAFFLPVLITSLTLLLVLSAAVWVHVGSISGFISLWKQWFDIVLTDSQYYDAAHYGSQCIKSALLRWSQTPWNPGFLSRSSIEWIWLALSAALSAGILAYWFRRKPATTRARGLFFSFGIFAYLWLMPETFKYSYPFIAIPLAFLLPDICKSKIVTAAIVLCATFLSIPGLDIVGKTLFFGIQRYSLPLYTSFFMAAVCLLIATRESFKMNGRRAIQKKPSPRLPRAALTADDWGLSQKINEGILELAQLGILRRVSILTAGEALEYRLNELLELVKKGKVQLGLHFNLSYGEGAITPLSNLLKTWFFSFGPAKQEWIQKFQMRLRQQLSRLKELKVPVSHLDGHEHVHLLPGLLKHLVPTLKEFGIRRVRFSYDPGLWFTPRFLINVFALLALPTLKKNQFDFDRLFYPQKADFEDRARLQAALELHADCEAICHPAVANDWGKLKYLDHYSGDRIGEYRALRYSLTE